MSYAELIQVKDYMGINTNTDDVLLMRLLDSASGIIDASTGRNFSAKTASYTFDAENIKGKILLLDSYDLLTVTKLTNGDGDEIASANYVLLPRNTTPKWQIKLKSGYDWEFDDEDSVITVAGTWGYSATPPDDIVHACIRLTSFLYRQKDNSSDTDRPLVTGDGVTIMPSSLPSDVTAMLKRYQVRI